jgi:hypothetical protein
MSTPPNLLALIAEFVKCPACSDNPRRRRWCPWCKGLGRVTRERRDEYKARP